MIGSSMPPPKPWATRKTIRRSTFQERPEASESSTKRESPMSHILLLPNRSIAQAAQGGK
ncbi:hypothetical protein P354_27375 [Streptomyces noursei PD-1]|nr:hypothetical protein K530_54625 [Streptomyces noursei CCRC 11814]EXU88745.1 hypothetical protein P354_27375 [Streptomyces noursei PD-1]